MDRGLAVIITACMGGLIATQAPINGRLGQEIGAFSAAAISFISGTILLTLIVLIAGDGFGRLGAASLPWYYFVGGILGAAYITTVIFTVGALGAGGITAATITGQLTASLALDHFGALGLDRDPVTAAKLTGVAMLAGGTYLILSS